MSVKNGDVVILQVGGVQIGALVSNSQNMSGDMLDKTNKDTPGIKQYNGGETGWGLSLESLWDPDASEGFSEALGYLKAGTEITVKHGDPSGLSWQGTGLISSIDLSGPKNEISSYSVEIQGSGDYSGTSSYSYDGSTQLSYVADGGALDPVAASTDYCISCWAKITEDGGIIGKYLVGKGIVGNSSYGLFINASNEVYFYLNTTTNDYSISTGIDTDTDTDWHHYMMRVDLSGARIYVYTDGVLINPGGQAYLGTPETVGAAFEFCIGAGSDGAGTGFDRYCEGLVRDVRVWQANVTAQVVTIMNGTVTGTEIARWPLGASGDADEAGSYDLTSVNSPTVVYV